MVFAHVLRTTFHMPHLRFMLKLVFVLSFGKDVAAAVLDRVGTVFVATAVVGD